MSAEELAARLRRETAAVGVTPTEGQIAALGRYLYLIKEWRRRARLTAVADPLEGARVHIADSLLCLRAGFPPGAAVMDVGSGAGLPGIPLAIIRPDLRVTLLEADSRKAGFLELAVRELALSAAVAAERAEHAAHSPAHRERYDVVVARAVAPLRVLLELTLPFVRVGRRAVLLKGPGVDREITTAAHAQEILGGAGVEVTPAALGGGERRAILTIAKQSATPAQYPRRAGIPARRPL